MNKFVKVENQRDLVRDKTTGAIVNINNDELVEITPKSIRLRKKFLKEHERKRSNK